MDDRPPESKSRFPSLQGDEIPAGICVLVLVAVIVVTGIVLVAVRHYGLYSRLSVGFSSEFLAGPGGYPGLTRHYGFRSLPRPMRMEPSVIYEAVCDGRADVIGGFTTDGRIQAYNLVGLEDDKSFFLPRYAAPLARSETLQKHPEIAGILNKLEGRIPNETMRNLNYKVEEKGFIAADVARGFLVSQSLIPPEAKPGGGSAGNISVGSKQSTEQEILCQIMATLIECNSDMKVIRNSNFGDTIACFNALESGYLDLYAEYTGTGLVDILRQEAILDSDKLYRTVKQAFRDEYSLIWLKPFGLNNTYTLIMRQDQAEKLGIATISDLLRYIRWRRGGVPPLAGQF